MALELIPIGTILAVLTNQVIKTAQAAKDVFDKESFKVLSKHLFDIELVLNELQLQELNDSQAARFALESLETDVKRANNLVEKYKNRSRFYLHVKCRNIVKEVQEVTRDIGKSLAALSLANSEVLSRISDQVNRLQNEMQRVEFEASQSQLQISDRLNQGQILDQGFANVMLEEIAIAEIARISDQLNRLWNEMQRVEFGASQSQLNQCLEEIAVEVGMPLEPSKISKELADIRKEKEEAANGKERAEAFFLGQVIELLSRADAARDYEEIKKQYNQRVQAIERYDTSEEYIPPLKPFICCIKGTVMVEPVSLCTGTTCERAAITAWFDSGETTDPETKEVLEDTKWRSNLPLRQSIEEWRELNYCLKIRSSRAELVSGVEMSMLEALSQMQDLMGENSINKDWIAIEGLTNIIISILGTSHNRDVKRHILITLKDIVEGHARNKEEVVDSQEWNCIIGCLGRDSSISKAAIELLYELLQDRSGWNVSVCKKLSQQCSTIIFLVTLLKGPVKESAQIAEIILMKLFDIDEENISRAAKSGWYRPLIDRIVQGPEISRIEMVRTLVNMEFCDSNLKLLGEEGIIPPLLEMASGSIGSKELSLSALVQLSSCHANKELIAASGGVNLILKLMFSPQVLSIIVAKCYEVLEKFTSDEDGAKFFVDENGCQLELEPIVTNLIELQQKPNLSYNVRRPALHTLHGICKFDAGLVKKAVLTANAISLVLPLLDNTESAIREIAINLLFLFSQHEPEGVVEYLLKPRRLEALVGFLENDDKGDVQMAAAGLLANLPKSESSLTMKLIELGGHTAIINILRTGNMEAKENALSALFRFTDPTNLESQRMLVEGGAYPLLVNFLRSSSVTAKARAAALIGNLSTSSQKLTVVYKPSGCWCFKASHGPVCPAHGGICSVTSTFCLLEAKALPDLVRLLLSGEVYETSIEAIQTLSTLVFESSPQRGANVLHEAGAINPILETLNWGTDSLREEALGLLEKVFMPKEMVEMYGSTARLRLASLTSRNIHEDGRHRRKAAKVMSLLERYSKSSTSILPGLHA